VDRHRDHTKGGRPGSNSKVFSLPGFAGVESFGRPAVRPGRSQLLLGRLQRLDRGVDLLFMRVSFKSRRCRHWATGLILTGAISAKEREMGGGSKGGPAGFASATLKHRAARGR
jgi:hypothetical protein